MQTIKKLTVRNGVRAYRDACGKPELPLLNASMLDVLDDLERYSTDADRGERWPLMRLGERQRIPRIVRRLVYERDGKCCLACGIVLTLAAARLDHIVPWSAGGPDTSDNLRVLCEPCNAGRSNYRTGMDDHAAKRTPVAMVCIGCFHLDDHGQEVGDPLDVTPGLVAAYCGWCGLVSRSWPCELY